MIQKFASRVLLLLALVVTVFTSAAQAEGDRFAAIAYSPSSGRYGTAYNCRSKGAAEERALENCRGREPQVRWARNAWIAVAAGDRGAYGFGWSADRHEARRIALFECSSHGGEGAHIVACVSSWGE